MQSCSDQADGWFPGTSDIDKEVLPKKKFSNNVKTTPPNAIYLLRFT